jgi:hypothetical protein
MLNQRNSLELHHGLRHVSDVVTDGSCQSPRFAIPLVGRSAAYIRGHPLRRHAS